VSVNGVCINRSGLTRGGDVLHTMGCMCPSFRLTVARSFGCNCCEACCGVAHIVSVSRLGGTRMRRWIAQPHCRVVPMPRPCCGEGLPGAFWACMQKPSKTSNSSSIWSLTTRNPPPRQAPLTLRQTAHDSSNQMSQNMCAPATSSVAWSAGCRTNKACWDLPWFPCAYILCGALTASGFQLTGSQDI